MDDAALQVRAAALDGDHCRQMETDDGIEAVLSGKQTVWLDVRWHDPKAAHELLADRLKFHPLTVEDALSAHERPALQELDGVLFLSVLAPVKAEKELKFAELAFFLKEKAIVTVSRIDIGIVDDWFDRWNDHPLRIGDHPGHLMHTLLDAAVDSYFPVIDELEDQVEEITEKIFRGDSKQLPEIMRLKRSMLEMRRAIAPTRDVLNSLLRRDVELVPDDSKIYFQDIYDHALRLTELIDSNRDALTSVLDVHLSTVSNNLNEVVKKMTVVSTVLMTMALIAGVYGMNFDKMPELHWQMGYPYALGLMFLSGVVTLVIFRIIRWI